MVRFKIREKSMTARAGVIKEAGFNIKTPIRVLNSRELEHGLKIQNSKLATVNFPHPIYEVTHYIKSESMYTMVKNAEASEGLKNQVEEKSLKAGSRFTIFHPIFDRNLEISNTFNKILIELQIQSEIDSIAILDEYNSTPEQFEKRLVSSIKQIDNSEFPLEPMPVIRLDTDDRKFGKKLKVCVDHNINIINLIYAPIKQNYANYFYLIKNMIDEDIWLHISELGRRICKKTNLMHIIPLFGIDSYALKARPIPIGKFEKKKKLAERFDSKTLGQLNVQEYKKLYGEKLHCDCFVDKSGTKRRTLSNSLKVFDGAQLLRQALACHEACSSFWEFNNSRKRILQNDYRNYLKNKRYMYIPLKKFFKIDLKNKVVSDY